MKSSFYYDGNYANVARKIKEYINSSSDFLSRKTAQSPRAVGDAVEDLISEKFNNFLGSWCAEHSSDFSRRAMADIAFTDKEQFYSVVDVKTHREDTKFSMPNLTSVERLSRFYQDDKNVFSLIMVKYRIEGISLKATEVIFSPIEYLDWDCLTVGALGWGQIQISDSNNIKLIHRYSRRAWMLKLCDVMLDFYPREIQKINHRVRRFKEVKAYWESREDTWK